MSKSVTAFSVFMLLTVLYQLPAEPFFYNSVSYEAIYKENPNADTQAVESYTIYFKPGTSIYLTITPYNDRVKASATVYDQQIYRETVLPLSWEQIGKKKFEDIIESSSPIWDWDLLMAAQDKTASRIFKTVTKRIDETLPEMKLADYKAMSRTGKWVDIADGSVYSRALINSFGFVKWIADGFYKPATGQLLDLNDLVLSHFEEAPNNNWLIKETFQRNPYFGLDWIKNIGLQLNRLYIPDCTINDIEIKDVPFYGFTETAGFQTSSLRMVLYYLAAKHPSRFYLISYSHPSEWKDDRTLLEHYKTAVAFPSIDFRGLLNVDYYENGLKIPENEIENRIGDSDIFLVGVEISSLFHLPPVKNLSILYR